MGFVDPFNRGGAAEVSDNWGSVVADADGVFVSQSGESFSVEKSGEGHNWDQCGLIEIGTAEDGDLVFFDLYHSGTQDSSKALLGFGLKGDSGYVGIALNAHGGGNCQRVTWANSNTPAYAMLTSQDRLTATVRIDGATAEFEGSVAYRSPVGSVSKPGNVDLGANIKLVAIVGVNDNTGGQLDRTGHVKVRKS